MSRASPDPITAHVELLRAVDRLLADALIVRDRREALDRLLSEVATEPPVAPGRQEVDLAD